MNANDLREQALQRFLDAKALVDPATGEIPAEAEGQFQTLMAEAMDLDKQYEQAAKSENGSVDRLDERLAYYTGKATGEPMRFQRTVLDPSSALSMGAQFVESQEYKKLQASGVLDSDSGRFDTGRVILTPRQRYGAAASDVIQSETSGPSNALVTPMYLPGILPLNQRPLTVRDLFSQASMSMGDQISYAQQSGFDNAAAAVAQATAVNNGAKPQSSIAWTRATADAEWIATWMVATRQALADSSVIRGIIDNQGRLMLQLEEEDQLLNGNGTPPNLSGILDQSIQTLDLTGEDNLDGVRTARRLVSTGISRLNADWIVLNPEDSEEFDLLKDLNDSYRGGNPIGNFGFNQSIWRLTRVESEALAQGTALVGARAGATVYQRQPITVLTADQHSDFFVRNLIVILFEERLAFPVFFPSAFVEVTLADWGS
jgi:hypothetical protein